MHKRIGDPKPPTSAQRRERTARTLLLGEGGWYLALRHDVLGPYPTAGYAKSISRDLDARLRNVAVGNAGVVQAFVAEQRRLIAVPFESRVVPFGEKRRGVSR